MNNTHKLKETLGRNAAKMILVICILQPLLDVLSFWTEKLGVSNTLTLLLRLAVLAAMVIVGFIVSERKKIYFVAAAISLVIGAGHIWACLDAGYLSPVQDLTNYIRVLQMPWTVISLISLMRANDDTYRYMKNGLVVALFIVLAVEVLAQITGTEPHTYMDGMGYIGWFNNTNSQSSILTILVPLAVTWLYINRGFKSPLFWVALLGGFTAMYFFGTRLCFFGIIATCFGLALSMFIIRRSDLKRALVLCLVGVLFLGLMPISPMSEHQSAYSSLQADRQNRINEEVENSDEELLPIDEEGISDEERERRKEALIEALTPVYSFYCADFVEIFGARRTIEMYNYSSDIMTMTETRPKKLQYARLLMEDSPASARIFGIELGRFTVGENNYDVENDLHGIYFLYGAVGLAAMLAFLLYFVGLVVWALIKDPKKYFTLDAAACGIALIVCLIHVYCTAGVLRRPNASFYLAIVLASVYYLVRIKTYPDKELQE